jgi:hypothetical protein
MDAFSRSPANSVAAAVTARLRGFGRGVARVGGGRRLAAKVEARERDLEAVRRAREETRKRADLIASLID